MKNRRSFPRYITEFMVIFIAVFLGFLAENFRGNLEQKTNLASFITIRHLDFSKERNLILFYEKWKPTAKHRGPKLNQARSCRINRCI